MQNLEMANLIHILRAKCNQRCFSTKRAALLCQKRVVFISCDREQDTSMCYEYREKRDKASLIVKNRIGELQLSTHPIFAVYK